MFLCSYDYELITNQIKRNVSYVTSGVASTGGLTPCWTSSKERTEAKNFFFHRRPPAKQDARNPIYFPIRLIFNFTVYFLDIVPIFEIGSVVPSPYFNRQ